MRGSATRADRRGTRAGHLAVKGAAHARMAAPPDAGSGVITVAVDTMGGDHGPRVTVAAALAFLARTPTARVILVGRENEVRQALAANRTRAIDRVTVQAASEVVEMHEPPARRIAPQEGLVDARRRQPGQGRRRTGVRLGGQYRRADGDLPLRAENPARHRSPGDRIAAADTHRRHDRARPGRQRQLHAGTTDAVRRHGQRAGLRGRRHRAPHRRPAQYRRRGHQGQRRRQADGGAAEGVGPQLSTATSKATTSTRAQSMSSFATASSATSR